MQKGLWREALEGKIKANRHIRFDIRQRAKRYMQDLTFILENMKNVSKWPEKDFQKIFSDRGAYLHMRDVLFKAFWISVCQNHNEDAVGWLAQNLATHHIDYHPLKLMEDRNYFFKKRDELWRSPEFRPLFDFKMGFPPEKLSKHKFRHF